jgi:hypothetical protein
MKKICPSCKDEKEVKEFNLNVSRKDGLSRTCKTCSKTEQIKSYQKRKSKYITNRKNYVFRNKTFIIKYLKIFGKCVDCGIKDIRVLEFDHINGNKVNSIAQLIQDAVSINTLKQEIKKCEIRCCNCHRIKTIITLDWYKK